MRKINALLLTVICLLILTAYPVYASGECYVGDSVESGRMYESLHEAVKNANGEKIILTGDVVWETTANDYYNASFILEGNGYTVRFKTTPTVNMNSHFTFKNVTLDMTGYHFRTVGNGKITLSDKASIINGSPGQGENGGAALVNAGTEFIMEKGSRVANCYSNHGGGAFHVNGGTLILNGGIIENCKAAGGGGGVIVTESGKLYLSGDATIKNNYTAGYSADGNTLNNIKLASDKSLIIKGDYTGTAGITLNKNTEMESFALAESGAKGAENLYSDFDSKIVGFDNSGTIIWIKQGKVPDAEELNRENVYLDKSKWTVTANSEQSPAKRVIDGNKGTFWHSGYVAENGSITSKDDPPFYLDINLNEEVAISGIVLTPRQDSNSSGVPTKARIYIYENEDWLLIKEYVTNVSHAERKYKFSSNIKVSKIRIEIAEGVAAYGTLAEVDLYKENSELKTLSYEEFIQAEKEAALYPVDKSLASAYYDGSVWSGNVAGRMVDGKESTFFQTGSPSTKPCIIDVDLGREYDLAAVSYYPRQGDDDGFWQEFDVEASIDGTEYTVVASTGNEFSYDRVVINFDGGLRARYFRFVVKKGLGNLASCTELDFYESYTQMTKRTEEEKEVYTLVIGSNKIKHKNGEVTLDTTPFIENGTTFIPLRGLLELMGAEISWQGDNQSITVKKGDTVIYLMIRNNLVDVTNAKYGKVTYTLLATPRIKDSRTFIPVRFVSEQLGYSVSWDGDTGSITISK